MKKNIFTKIIIAIILIGLAILSVIFIRRIIQSESEEKTKLNVSDLVNKSPMIPDRTPSLNSIQLQQIEFYEYLFSEYIRPLGFDFTSYFYAEDLFTSRLFSIESGKITLRMTDIYDEDKFVILYDFYYKNGLISKIVSKENPYYQTRFIYSHGKLIEISTQSKTPLLKSESQSITEYSGGDKITELVKYKYYNGIPCSRTHKTRYSTKREPLMPDFYSADGKILKSKKKRPPFDTIEYLKYSGTKSSLIVKNNRYYISFIGNNINEIVFYKRFTSDTVSEFSSVYRINNYGNTITIDEYGNNPYGGWEKYETYFIKFNGKSDIESVTKNEYITEDYTRVTESLYRYVYVHGKLTSYAIYEGDISKDKNPKKELDLKKSVELTSR